MDGLVSFLKCLTVMDLSLAMKDVSRLAQSYTRWEGEAAGFMKSHKVFQAFTKVSNSFRRSKWEFTEDHGDELGAALKAALPSFVADQDISHAHLAMFKDLSLFMRKDSGPAWDRINKNVSMLGDNELAAMFLDADTKDVADMSTVQAMEKIVYALTKRKNDPILTVNEMRDGKASNPKLIERYSELRKAFKANYLKSLMKFVRLSGKPLVDVARAKAYLEAMGCNYLPVGFVGKVDEQGKLYTTAGKALKGTMFGRMQMNPAYDPKTDNTYYCKLVGDMRGELRTVEFLKGNKAERYDLVDDFSDNIEHHRKNWLKGIDSLDPLTQEAACIVEIIHLTQARIGGLNNENDGQPTFGISTLQVRHARITPQGLEMKYPGKKGTMQHHIIRPDSTINRKIIKLVKQYMAGKDRTARIFTVGGRPIKPREVNNYLKSIGVSVTVHKFRHAAATKTAKEMLAKSPFSAKNKPTQAQAERWIKEEAIKIGTMLHHRTGSGDKQRTTSSTAIASYINPTVLKAWFVKLGLRAPKWLPVFDD